MDSLQIVIEPVSPEESAIKSLRALIPDVISENKRFDSNLYLLQWLKAEKLNPEKTESRIRKSIQWRQENQTEVDWNDEKFLEFKTTFGFMHSTSKQGGPVGYMRAGKNDYRGGSSKYGRKTWVKYWAKYFAILEDIVFNVNYAKNSDLTKICYESSKEMTVIVDTKGFSLYQLASFDAIKIVIEIATNIRNYFPALFELCIFINMNKVFEVCLKAIKPILTVPYMTLEIYGANEKDWKDRTLQIIDDKQLRGFLEA